MLERLTQQQRAAYREMIEETLGSQGDVEFETSGTSMRYMLTKGDRVVVRGCKISEFRFGDVVLLKDREQENRLYLVHRIVSIKNQDGEIRIETKGDSSPKDCFLFNSETCLGKVICFTHRGQAYSLQHKVWTFLDPAIALMSLWVSYFSEQAAKRGKKKQVLVQRLLHSIIKRLVRLGMQLSRQTKSTSPSL